MDKSPGIFVAGHRGMVGSALVRLLRSEGYENLMLRSRAELDLTDARAVDDFLHAARPSSVILAAARVGGILDNATHPAEFIRENLAIQTNVIHSSWRCGVRKLLFIGSSVVFPRLAPQPIPEAALMTGPLEPTNQAYAVAKIAGIAMCQAYRTQYGFDAIAAMPGNLYGPHDRFGEKSGHVLPSMLERFHRAKLAQAETVTIWGTGRARREFLHVDDLARAVLFLMEHYSEQEIINVGPGEDITILDLARLVAEVVEYRGEIVTDTSKPDGTPRKLLDVSRLNALGWHASIPLADGVRKTYRWFLAREAQAAIA